MDTLSLIWKRSPFLRLLLPLMLGIILNLFFPLSRPLVPLYILLLLFAWLVLFLRIKAWRTPQAQAGRGLVLNALLLTSGFLLAQWHRVDRQPAWYGHHLKHFDYALVRLSAAPEIKPRTVKLRANLVQLLAADTQQACLGEVLLYIKKADSLPALQEGDYLLVQNTLSEIRPSGNPGSFNYAAYCQREQVFHMAFLKAGQWRKLPLRQPSLASRFTAFNQQVRTALTSCLPDSQTRGIAEALLIGYRQNVDPEIWQAYSQTGIVHIIAISGMHMAMVYQSLRWLLLQLPWFRKRPAPAVLLAVLFMWLFAILTGLPPSVSRAAFMFTLIGLGELSGRNIPIYNNLAGSAFLLLCIQPFWIADVGFQLSYLAVLSLAMFYQPIYQLLYVPFRMADGIWKLVAGTLAAQVLTFPLCMYYFHQFPLVFVFTNLVAVPLSTLILYIELLLLAVRCFDPLAMALGQLISHLINLMNFCILQIGQWPYAVWKNLHLSLLQCILLFALVLSLSLWLLRKKAQGLIAALALGLGLLITQTLRQWEILHQTHIVLYQTRGGHAMQFIQGPSYVTVFDQDDSLQQQQYVLEPARLHWGLSNSDSTLIRQWQQPGLACYSFAGQRIARLTTTRLQSSSKLRVDLLVLGKGYKPGNCRLTDHFQAGIILLDSSIPFWLCDTIRKELRQSFRGPIHVVGEQGAWVWSKSI